MTKISYAGYRFPTEIIHQAIRLDLRFTHRFVRWRRGQRVPHGAPDDGGSFTEAQVQIVLLTDAVTNECAWAAAFHTTLALKEGIGPAEVRAIREGRLPKDGKLAALSALAKTMIEKRGRLDDQDLDRFLQPASAKIMPSR
jgi:AhpD family alkylhydroperoxidase